MLILGFFSILQVLFIPGFLLTIFLRLELTFLKRITLSSGISLLFNYCIVSIFIIFGIYCRTTMLILLGLEAIVLLYLYRQRLSFIFKIPSRDFAKVLLVHFASLTKRVNEYSDKATNKLSNNNKYLLFSSLLIFIAALSIVILSFSRAFHSIGDVFETCDAIASWNRWAIEWSQGHFPVHTYHYPQLIPANWSICYVMIGETLEIFPKIANAFIYPMLILAIFLWGVEKRSPGMLLGCVVTALSFMSAFREYLYDGYVDISVAYMLILPLYCLFLASRKENKADFKKYLFIGMLLAFGAALTKQAGLLIVIGYPIFALYLIKSMGYKSIKISRGLLIYLALIFICILPSYFYQEYMISQGHSHSEIEWVTNGIHGERTLVERLGHASILFGSKVFHLDLSPETLRSMVPSSLSGVDGPSYYSKSVVYVAFTFVCMLIFIPLCIFSIISSFFSKKARISAILFLFLWLIWGVFFSYDIRNAAIAIPFWGNTIGLGVWGVVCCRNYMLARYFWKGRYVIFIIVFAGVLLTVTRHVSPASLREKNLESKIQNVCDPTVNRLLLEHKEEFSENKKIASNYWGIFVFHEMKDHSKYFCFARMEKEKIIDRYIKSTEPDDIGFILLRRYKLSEDLLAYINSQVEQGHYLIREDSPSCLFIEKIERE
jgi:hypothetical protein